MIFFNKIFRSQNSRTQKLKNNIIGAILIKGISMLVSFILVPLTLGYVDTHLYGIWITLSSVIIWLNIFDVGFNLGLKNKLCEAISIGNIEKGKELVSTTYFIMSIIFIPLGIFVIILSHFIDWSVILNVENKYNEEIIATILPLTIGFSLQMIFNVILAVLSSFQMVALSSLFNVVGNLLSLIVIFILTKTVPSSLPLLGWTLSIMPVLVLIIASCILYSGKFKSVSPSFRCIRKSYINDLFGLGYKFFLIQIQGIILYQSANLIITNVDSPDAVTTYNIAYKYITNGTMIFSIMLNPLWPAFTEAYTKKDFDWMNQMYKKMVKVYYLFALLTILMVIVSPIVYKIWVGDKVYVPWAVTIALGLYMIINSWDTLQVSLINGIGTVALQMRIVLIGLFFHVPLAFYLGKLFGICGVILSMIIINIIYASCFTTQIRKILSRKAEGIWLK